MNKKIALTYLIEASVFFTDEEKLALIRFVPSLTDKQVEVLGKYLALERQFVLDHEAEITEHIAELLGSFDTLGPEKVFVGSSAT